VPSATTTPDDVEVEAVGGEERDRRHGRRGGPDQHEEGQRHDDDARLAKHGEHRFTRVLGDDRPTGAGPLAHHQDGEGQAERGDGHDSPEDRPLAEQADHEGRDRWAGHPREGEDRAGLHDAGHRGADVLLVREEQADPDARGTAERHQRQDRHRQAHDEGQGSGQRDGQAAAPEQGAQVVTLAVRAARNDEGGDEA
jgi:hypothetical protein